eukprot:CAMPEP_0185767916 /NCGR_PEP_ID=MMETSP1174-20130828/45763_1 /TAXON_ID=35687 /ORGANISM="Dictyocha speculum, Strain CCMP1381" /LENGTH=150 /DNA_ID=CAMNT_0028452309 /DNA_START=192 /DNA_END=644 /DNA_ORIENTATION=+
MSRKVITLQPGQCLKDAAKILITEDITGAPVVNECLQIVGVLSRSDILFKIAGKRALKVRGEGPRSQVHMENTERLQKIRGDLVSDVMTRQPVSVDVESTMQDAAALMVRYDLNRLTVTKDGQLVGLISSSDILKLALCDDEVCDMLPYE